MSGPGEVRPVRILLVEDNPGDVRLLEEAFEEAHIANDLRVFSRGKEAIAYLAREGEYADGPRPDLVLTCLRLPDASGSAVIEAVRSDPALADVPVIACTGSPGDPERLDDVGADAHLEKPIGGDDFVRACREVGGFWIRIVKRAADVG